MNHRTRSAAWLWIATILLILSTGAALRLCTAKLARIDGDSVLLDFDPYYHIRRAELIADGIGLPERDYYTAFPQGGIVHWEPLFDYWLASAILTGRLFGISSEASVSVVPVILGTLNILIMGLFFRLPSERVPFLAAMTLLAILPAHIRPSSYSFADHHVMEVLLTTLAMGLLSRAQSGKQSIIAGIALGVSQLAWRGAVFLTGIALISLAVQSFIPSEPERKRMCALGSVQATASALITYLSGFLLGWVHPGYTSFFELSQLQGLPFALFLCASGIRYEWLSCRSGRMTAWIAATIVVGAHGVAGSWDIWLQGFHFLLGNHRWRETITESRSIFSAPGFPPFGLPEELFSALVYLLPVIGIAWIVRVIRKQYPETDSFLLVWCMAALVLTLRQHRYAHQLAVPFCIMMGLALHRFKSDFASLSKLYRYLGGLFVLAGFIPLCLFLYYAVGHGFVLWSRIPDAHYHALTWMRVHTPGPGSFSSPEQKPAYGVMNSWEMGHWITWIARRPASANNFGSEPGGHEEALRSSCEFLITDAEQTARDIMDREHCRYLITENFNRKLYGFAHILDKLDLFRRYSLLDTVSLRLHLACGSDLSVGTREGRQIIRGVDGFRLIYESAEIESTDWGIETSKVKIFERDDGIPVKLPDTIVYPAVLETIIRTNTGRTFAWERHIPDAHARVRVSYDPSVSINGIQPIAPYRLKWRDGEVEVSIPENQPDASE